MDDLVCVTVRSEVDESDSEFAARLSEFWTHMLRNHKDDFELVYAETTEFEKLAGRYHRQYLADESVVALLEEKLQAANLDYEPIDLDDRYSKYEAVPPEWMQIEH